MSKNLFIRRRFARSALDFTLELTVADKFVRLRLLAAAIDLEIAQNERAFAVLLQKNKRIWRPEPGRVEQVGIGLTRGNDQTCLPIRIGFSFHEKMIGVGTLA